jgi:lysophospholipase L1-like esterase
MPWKLDCSNSGKTTADSKSLAGSNYRSADGEQAFGFDLGPPPAVLDGACTSNAPFFVSVAADDGNYRVTVTLGNPGSAAVTTVKAEARRLMLEQVSTQPGETVTRSFVVHVRTPSFAPAGQVELKPREIGVLDWDHKLTLAFTGTHPTVRSIEIERANVPTVYLAGDSTVVDQDNEPWAAWGQMLPAFFNDKIAIANEAESGETIASFVSERRFDKIMTTLRRGDYLLMQFAHNDQKAGPGFVPIPVYKDLLRRYIAFAREKGATPVLVTSMNRRTFAPDGTIMPTLGGYPDAMREVAAEQKVTLLDLNRMSKTLYEAMGSDGTLKAFVHYPAHTFADRPEELKDDTHFNSYGAFELARCMVHMIQTEDLPLAQYLLPGTGAFDPAHPDPVASWTVPPDPFFSAQKPYER